MSDHHVDTMENFDYQAAAEEILKRQGLFIANAPAINHKPGNDFWSDVNYPFPNYPDNRFRNEYESNNQIKDDLDNDNNCNGPRSSFEDLVDDFDMPDEFMDSMKKIKNPVITFVNDQGRSLIENTVHPYTGLTLQVVEKKAYDISFLKPKCEEDTRTVELHNTEVITGHLYSIATFDGYNYHIFRGLCIDILKVEQRNYNTREVEVTPRSTPWGDPMSKDTDIYSDSRKLARVSNINGRYPVNTLDPSVAKLIQRNVRIILDVSQPFKSGMECIPVNQIIDIQEYDHAYDFTIYEGDDVVAKWHDWYQEKEIPAPHEWTTYVSGDGKLQTLQHPVIEHQKPNKIK